MANTTNYNWETPDDTDLVKDGAAAIRTLGSSIDTTTKALNPETTLGDIAYRSATANTNTRLAVGTTGQVLTVAGGVPTWAAAASGPTFPAFRVYRATDQSITANVWTKVSLNTETFDTNNNFDSTTNFRFTPTVAGYYQINGNAYIYGSGTGNWQSSIYKNGSMYAQTIVVGGTAGAITCSAIVYFNGSSDYIEFYVRGSASSGNTVSGGITENYLDGVGIRS
jgi:hypothetical protein